jgi:porin
MPSVGPTVRAVGRLATPLATAALLAVASAGPATATPPEQPDVVPTANPSYKRNPVVREAWRSGKAEVDYGQGIIGKLLPDQRDWLEEHGILLFGWYMIGLQGNPSGGITRDFDYTGLFDFGLDLDFETMFGAKGLFLHASGSWASGQDLSQDVGSLAPVNAVFSGDAIRLFELYLEQQLFDDTLSVRAGRLSVGWEYGLEYDVFTQYLSAAFRLNVFALDDNDENFSVIPFANWGARVRYTPNEHWRFQFSFMNGYPRDFADDQYNGTLFDFEPGQGAFFIAEGSYQWAHTSAERKARPGRMPGRVTLGAYYDTGTFPYVDGSGRTASTLFNVYGIVRQKVWEPEPGDERGLDLWTSLVVGGREEIVSVQVFWSGGALWTGPLAFRPDDTVAVGFASSWVSDGLAGSADNETVLELSYNWNVSEQLTITPDFQYIVNPGGNGAVADAVLLGALFYLTF